MYAQINVKDLSTNGKCSLSNNYFPLFKQYVHLFTALSTGITNAASGRENNLMIQTPSKLSASSCCPCDTFLSYRRAAQCSYHSFVKHK